ncbi:MAG TPA: alpha/beta fold hydrolase [Verrucomicrobiae bacterium]|nr:alpha/beta fold hydrolase [Verrucomicrobiae bacterium]
MQLHFKELGRGEPLVMLHGLFGSGDNWLGVAPKLADSFRVLLPDLRNHGQSPHSDAMDYPLMAADLKRLLDGAGLAGVDLLGHSLGGKVAMQFALAFPKYVRRLVVVDMAPRRYTPEHEPIFEALLAMDLKTFESRREMEESLAPKFPDLALRRFLLKNIGRHEDGSFFWKMNLRGLHQNYLKLGELISSPAPFRKPALFLRGGKSKYVSAADETLIRQLFPEVRFETIAHARHWVHADAPDEFIGHVKRFLGAAAIESGAPAA